VIRVTGGSFCGRNLRVPADGVRPTPSMVRGALFSILGGLWPDGCEGRTMLDLFAGSGVMTVEALGRGMAAAVCVEKARPVFQVLRGNIEVLHLADRARCLQIDANQFLANDATGAYDLIYMDPPYALTDLRDAVLLTAGDRCRLTPDGVLLLEQDVRHNPPPTAGCLTQFMTRRWGQTQVSFYHVAENSRLPRIV
jgi:16S rRNA (guanine966-N2)-methyltransferase